MDVSLEPLDEFVVVQPVSDETETRAGLILPASATESAPCRTGIVTAIGADVTGVDAGVILEEGTPTEIFGAPREPRTQQFLERIVEAGRL